MIEYSKKYYHWMETMGLYQQLSMICHSQFEFDDCDSHYMKTDRGYHLLVQEFKDSYK